MKRVLITKIGGLDTRPFTPSPTKSETELSKEYKVVMESKQLFNCPLTKSENFFRLRKIFDKTVRSRIVLRGLGCNDQFNPYFGWEHMGAVYVEPGSGCIICCNPPGKVRIHQVLHSNKTNNGICICCDCSILTMSSIKYNFNIK